MTSKPSSVEFPFASNLIESLELMRKVFGAGFPQVPGFSNPAGLPSSLPSIMVPTLDVDELDKRIEDLRAVEQWLALNAGILRTSIQALEVQRNTIATLKSLGETLATVPAPAPAAAQAKAAGVPTAPAPATAPKARGRRTQAKEERPPNLVEMPMNPAAWWGTLQDQFTRIAAAAAGETGGKAAAASADANKPAVRKPPAKRTS